MTHTRTNPQTSNIIEFCPHQGSGAEQMARPYIHVRDMRKNERTRQLKRRERTRIQRAKIRMVSLMAALVVFLAVIIISATAVSATPGPQEPKNKYYTSITVQPEDTLWTIAGTYYDSSTENRKDYIKNIKTVNGLSDDTIKAGNHLVIYYWADEAQ